MSAVSVWRYLFWDVQQYKDQPHYTIAHMQQMQNPCCQTQTGQNIHEMGLSACAWRALESVLKTSYFLAWNTTELAWLQRQVKHCLFLWVSFSRQVSIWGIKASFYCVPCADGVNKVPLFPPPSPACAAHLWRWCWSLGLCRCGRSGTPVGLHGRWSLSREAGRLRKKCQGSAIQPDGTQTPTSSQKEKRSQRAYDQAVG